MGAATSTQGKTTPDGGKSLLPPADPAADKKSDPAADKKSDPEEKGSGMPSMLVVILIILLVVIGAVLGYKYMKAHKEASAVPAQR